MEKSVSRVNKIASGVGLVYGKSILLAKRISYWEGIKVNYGGYWSIFGGVVEEGETTSQSAVRELKEESQIEVSEKNLIFIKTIQEPIPQDTLNPNFQEVEFSFYISELDKLTNPILNEEHTEFGWFNMDSLTSFTEKIDPKIIDCVNLYRSNMYKNV